jgi:uroporphyrinogen III methyltransferase / synthase
MGLRGRVVVVTRSRDRAEALSTLLRERGALPIEAPAIRIEPVPPDGPLDRAVGEAAAGAFDWVAFTSAAGVEAFFGRVEALDAEPPSARVAAVGAGTADALAARGLRPDLVPATYTTAALGEAFPEGTGRVLLPRADIATPELEEAVAAKGWTPLRVDAYRSLPERSLPAQAAEALREGRVDAVVFTSRSTVQGFVGMAGGVGGAAVVCIGPVTAEAAREAGLEVSAVAEPHTLEGVVAALERLPDRDPGR